MKTLLTNIHEDMPVYDREGNKIGTVETVQFGDEDLDRPGVETATAQTPEVERNDWVEDFARAISFDDRLPEELRAQLQRYGYIKVDTGILSSDRYARADQIANVSDDRVNLNTTLDDLIKS